MTETDKTTRPPDFDPDQSPFETPPIEVYPYKRGSAEDLAIRRVLEREQEANAGT
jgi:hypothetical protein